MNKLTRQSRDVVGGNVAKSAALFPQCVTERINKNGKPELAIDFEKLRAELLHEAIGEGEERYQLTWLDKRAASRLANEPTIEEMAKLYPITSLSAMLRPAMTMCSTTISSRTTPTKRK